MPQTAKYRAEENKRKRISRGNAAALWCHALLGLQQAVLAALLNVLSSFTFLHSLDGMESSSESSAMEEAHGDEQGSLSSSARKLFALWEKICSHEMRFFPASLYSLSFPPSSALSAWSTVTILPYLNFLLLNKRIFTLATWVEPTDPGSSGSFLCRTAEGIRSLHAESLSRTLAPHVFQYLGTAPTYHTTGAEFTHFETWQSRC